MRDSGTIVIKSTLEGNKEETGKKEARRGWCEGN